MRVVLATANPGKQREFAALLEPRGLELVLQSALGIASIPETGRSLEDNAVLKARHAAAAGFPALADDSGLEVDALGGRPGVWSARFAGPTATEEENNRALLQALAEVPGERRTARYRCVLALLRNAAEVQPLIAQGSWEGRIARQRSGTGGFGYDSCFIPAGFECTAAELSPARKNALSHRGAALRELVVRLDSWR